MKAVSAFSPAVRNSSSIKFLQNIDETLAKVCNALLKERTGGITFVYNDDNKLFFLVRELKNTFFRTLHLPDGWMSNKSVKETLINQFEASSTPHTYILLFDDKNCHNYTKQFLQRALMHRQLRKDIQVIAFSVSVGCSIYENFLKTGASLITFGLSNVYAPWVPKPFYSETWYSAGVYLDGLTYITTNGSQLPRDYILSKISFVSNGTGPVTSPVESLAVLDCSVNTEEGIGSWVSSQSQLRIEGVNNSIRGRTIAVGVVNYPPFYDNGTGFSVPIMTALQRVAGIGYTIKVFNPQPGRPYYEDMQTALENGKIDVGFAPMTLSSIHADKVDNTFASLTVTFNMVRQRPQRPPDYLLILRPLAMPVWLASVVLAFIFMGLLMLFGHLKPVILRNLAEGEMTTKRDLFEVSALGVASSFSLTKLQIIPTTLSSRLFALVMWMFCYLLLVLYASAMMTILLRIRTPSNAGIPVDEVVNSQHGNRIIVLSGGIAYDAIIQSLKNLSKPHKTVDTTMEAYEELMKSDRNILIASSVEASYISVMDCALENIPYTLLYDSIMVFPYSQEFPYQLQLNFYMEVIQNAGVIDNAASVYFETGRCYQPSYSIPTPDVMELSDSTSIYIFLLIGIIVSFIILGIELSVKYIIGEKETRELTMLVPGRQYRAEIVSMRRNGIIVKVADRPEKVYIPNSQLHPDPLKVYNALDMGLSEGQIIEVAYFGKGSDGITDLFCRHFPES